jgi:hypothetical protein
MAEEKTVFDRLFAVDVSKQIEKKTSGNGKELSYLSWSFAWANVKKRYPDASYEIMKFGEKQTPYVYDEKTGYMVFTRVTIEKVTHEMWLPVMDNRNEAMLDHPRQVKYKNYTATVEAATMFDVNKTIMRCLTKNLAMFGLGLYIYAGEDLPVDIDTTDTNISELLKNAQSWHEKLDLVASYYVTDIPDENLKMIKETSEGNSEEDCKAMYERTRTYLNKKGFVL